MSSYPSPPTSLPPRPSSALAFFTSSSSSETDSSQVDTPTKPTSTRRPHDNTHSTFSSRFLTSLLSSSRPAELSTSPSAEATLHALFATTEPTTHSKLHELTPHSTNHESSASRLTEAVAIPQPHHSRYVSSSSSHSVISHGTPFASHISSFFATSGAPGFSGEDHMWDKGFSEDYDGEKADRSGVLLKGRREDDGCVGVLDTDLAGLVGLISIHSRNRYLHFPSPLDTTSPPSLSSPSRCMDSSLQPRSAWYLP